MSDIEKAYELAKARYAELGIDSEAAIKKISSIPISLHCWQGDDVLGFEGGDLSGGIMATGNYPGRAKNADQLRADLEKTLSLIPGRHRLNLHAIYAETGGKKVERNKLGAEHFGRWIDWGKIHLQGIDFNPTFFSHPKADDGFTLSHTDSGIRKYWIEHGIASRKIAESIGRKMNSPCVNNIWIPDGFKDVPFDRKGPRERLKESLDAILEEKIDSKCLLDSVESKLFGIGSESYVVGSHEFYMGYAVKNNILLCLDSGHFHPTEVISDKISAVLTFLDEILLHVSRGVRWDSDHVVILSDELKAIAQEIIRGSYEKRVHIGLDFFDASINRLAAWVIGARSMIKALLMAAFEPCGILKQYENECDYGARLALFEELKTLPFGAVWDYYCTKHNVPVGMDWLKEIKKYEQQVTSLR